MSGFTSGRGNFGDHSGRAKSFLSPKSWLLDSTDGYQAMLWENQIFVDVRAVEYNATVGRMQLFVVGAEAQVLIARAHCKRLDPPVDVVCRNPVSNTRPS